MKLAVETVMLFVVTTSSIKGSVKFSLVLIWKVKDEPSLVQLKVLSPNGKLLTLLAGEFNDNDTSPNAGSFIVAASHSLP